MSEGYDEKPDADKNKIPIADTTGFLTKDGQRRFIIDQNTQLDLRTMQWFAKDDLVLVEPRFEDEISMGME